MKFRRKSADEKATEALGEETAAAGDADAVQGPFDADDLPDDGAERVDLGSLLIAPPADRELRMQVDEASGTVQSVMLAGPDGAVEIRAFAAPRNGDLWSEVRPKIAADMAQRGGTASEREGRFGSELVCEIQVQRPEGNAVQHSRIVGINGPRWMLRASLLGQPAVAPDDSAAWEDSIRKVVVHRGAHAMPVGESLPIVMPAQARRLDPPAN